MENRDVVLRYRDRTRIEKLAAGARKRLRIVDGRSAYLIGRSGEGANFDPVRALKALLQPNRLPL